MLDVDITNGGWVLIEIVYYCPGNVVFLSCKPILFHFHINFVKGPRNTTNLVYHLSRDLRNNTTTKKVPTGIHPQG